MKERNMISRRKAIGIALIAFLIPVLIISVVGIKIYQAVTLMGEEQMSGKTKNYHMLQDVTPKHATVFFGDSTTELCPLPDIYAPYVETQGIPVINRGISAEKTDTMVTRLDDVLALEPRNLVLLMGINDYYADVPKEDIVENIQTIIQTTKQTQPETNIILQAIYPVNANMRTTALEKAQSNGDDNALIKEINQDLKTLAETEEITFLDVTSSLIDQEGNLDSAYTFDGLHPNANGYLAIRDQIIAVLK